MLALQFGAHQKIIAFERVFNMILFLNGLLMCVMDFGVSFVFLVFRWHLTTSHIKWFCESRSARSHKSRSVPRTLAQVENKPDVQGIRSCITTDSKNIAHFITLTTYRIQLTKSQVTTSDGLLQLLAQPTSDDLQPTSITKTPDYISGHITPYHHNTPHQHQISTLPQCNKTSPNHHVHASWNHIHSLQFT